MRKFLIIWFVILFLVKCDSNKNKQIEGFTNATKEYKDSRTKY